MRTFGLVLAAAACAALIAGSQAGASARLSKPQYIAKADGLCNSAIVQIKKLGKVRTRKQAASLAPRWLVIDRRTLAALRGLAAPSADRATISKLLGLADTAINRGLVDVFAAAKSGSDAKYYAAVKRFTAMSNKAHAAASVYGLRTCARW